MTTAISGLGRTVPRTTAIIVGLSATATGAVAGHGTTSYGGSGMMGGSGLGLVGGTMGLWGILWMGLLLAIPAYLLYTFASRNRDSRPDQSLPALRERYARGEISDEEFQRRRELLDRAE